MTNVAQAITMLLLLLCAYMLAAHTQEYVIASVAAAWSAFGLLYLLIYGD